MGKKNIDNSNSNRKISQQLVTQKQPMHKFLPYKKYLIKKNKLWKQNKKKIIHQISIDKFQVQNAINCLKEYIINNDSKKNLFQSIDSNFIYLEIILAQVPTEHSIRPIQIPLPTPIYSPQLNSRYSILCCDPDNNFIQKIQKLDLPMLAQVIGYNNLKKNYQQLKDKQSLLNSNDLFFCDWKIYNLLRQPLGKLFYQRKKFPYPIDCEDIPQNLKKKGFTFEQYLNDLTNYTYLMMGNGPVYSLKVGRIGMETKDLVKNIIHAAYNTIPHIISKDIGVDKVRQILVKGYNSPSLPIYNNLTTQQIKIWKSSTNQQKQIKNQEILKKKTKSKN